MIALKDGLPLLELDGGRVVALEREWMISSLIQAASKAGYPQWWLAEHVTESIATFLRLCFQENSVTLPRLAEAVQSVLQGIGYEEVAHHFAPVHPPIRVSLLEMAKEAGTGYELAFFQNLGHSLRRMLAAKTDLMELRDLERCVKQLRTKKNWSRDCENLRIEIVAFVREQIHKDSPSRKIHFSLT